MTGFDARFPNQNQTKHCWQNYVDYHKCITAKGEDFKPCRQVCGPAKKRGLREEVLMAGLRSSTWPTSRFAQLRGARGGTTRGRMALSRRGWMYRYGQDASELREQDI